MKHAIVLSALAISLCAGADLPAVKPPSLGFSNDRLQNLRDLIQHEIDQKQLAGAVTILARHGKVLEYRTYGQRDMQTREPMRADVIFRAYSMTKPVTGVAMMILYEQGRWLPWDPISKYIPEFAHLKVFKGFDGSGNMILAEPEHLPTIGEVMSHSAGFSYGSTHSPVDVMYHEKKVMQSANLREMIEKLATIPLNYQPGTGWRYSVGLDIEGYLVEKFSGQSLPDFMRDHIFAPLGMKDSGFFVSQDKRSRFAVNYAAGPAGQLEPVNSGGSTPTDYTEQPAMPSGGGGMVSTAEDYYHFAQMLANGGEFEGKRVLAPATVKLMTSNHLAPSLLTGEFGIGQSIMRRGFGYGYNCAVVVDPLEAGMSDGKGTFFWDGAAGTWFWVDPANDVVFVAMIQRMTHPDNHSLEYRSHAAVYSALTDASK
ncbi:MAG: beta-lactamase family protein [Acidobacteriaceae bacterium]|nr:beta-lactamase family protein [Acidobacteriaceae bacterium]MBV9781252.1 beta-lactamase family protein [Acidobacteriaceae bacterium]